jgi:hypothetical protein
MNFSILQVSKGVLLFIILAASTMGRAADDASFEDDLLRAKREGLIQPMIRVYNSVDQLEEKEVYDRIDKVVDDYANQAFEIPQAIEAAAVEVLERGYRQEPLVLRQGANTLEVQGSPSRHKVIAARILMVQTILALIAKAKGATDAAELGFFERRIVALRGVLNFVAVPSAIYEFWHAMAADPRLVGVGAVFTGGIYGIIWFFSEMSSSEQQAPPQERFLYRFWAEIAKALDFPFALPRRVFSRGAPHQRRLGAYAIAKLEARGLIEAGSSKRLLNALLKNASAGAARACDANLLPPSRLLK